MASTLLITNYDYTILSVVLLLRWIIMHANDILTVLAEAWAAQPWGVGGSMSPSLLGPAGYRGGTGGGPPMKMIFASTADSFYSVLYK